METKEKLTIKETREAFVYAIATVEDLKKHKADDGKIDVAEIAQTLMTNASAAVQAVIGADKIPAEVSDLDATEVREVAEMGVSLLKGVFELIMIGKPS